MSGSVSLTSGMADVLFDTACIMIRDDSRRKSIKYEGIEGRITTSFDKQALGSICGVEFLAEVETDLGKGKVKFIVREAEAKVRNELQWMPFFTIEDMVMDELTPSRCSPMYN